MHNGNSTLRQSYTQKTAYYWWRMAYFSHSARYAPPELENKANHYLKHTVQEISHDGVSHSRFNSDRTNL